MHGAPIATDHTARRGGSKVANHPSTLMRKWIRSLHRRLSCCCWISHGPRG